MTGDPKIAARLRAARAKAGYEQGSDAARAFGWTVSTYGSHENGTRGIGRAAKAYARAFKVPLGWLLNGEGSPDDLHPEVSRGPSATHKMSRRIMPVRGAHDADHGNVIDPKGGADAESFSGERWRAAELAETRMVPELDVRAGAGAASADLSGLDGSVPVVA